MPMPAAYRALALAGALLPGAALGQVLADQEPAHSLGGFASSAAPLGLVLSDPATFVGQGLDLGTWGLEDSAPQRGFYTPRLGGMQLTLSYTDAERRDPGQQQPVDLGASYATRFDSLDVAVGGSLGIAGEDAVGVTDGARRFGLGARLGYHGFTVGGAYRTGGEVEGGATRFGLVPEGPQWDLGVEYSTGPWGFSLSYSRFDAAPPVGDQATVAVEDDAADQVMLGLKYRLADGVDVGAFGAYVDPGASTGQGQENGSDLSGFIVGSGVEIDF